MMKSYCSQCGLCCTRVDTVPEFSEHALPDGRCQHLTSELLCAIYESRPELCRADKMYEKYYADHLSEDDYYAMLISLCKKLQSGAFNG